MLTLHCAPTRNGSTSGWPSNTKATLQWTGTHGPKEIMRAITQVNVLRNGTPSKAAAPQLTGRPIYQMAVGGGRGELDWDSIIKYDNDYKIIDKDWVEAKEIKESDH